jgi:hypothetical protein
VSSCHGKWRSVVQCNTLGGRRPTHQCQLSVTRVAPQASGLRFNGTIKPPTAATKTMEYVLVHYWSRPIRLIRNLAKEIWPHQRIPWPNIDQGTTLRCGGLPIPRLADQNEQRGHGTHHRCKGWTRCGLRISHFYCNQSSFVRSCLLSCTPHCRATVKRHHATVASPHPLSALSLFCSP